MIKLTLQLTTADVKTSFKSLGSPFSPVLNHSY